MIGALALVALALGAPTTVVTFDNGGFNLPLYTARWNGSFAQPSVAQQLASDVSRLASDLRVFSYLPPGATPGRSSDPFEVVPRRPGCPKDADAEACACPAGERCWDGLDVNRDPAASTSLFQAATAIRARVPGPRVEIHVSDLFEEDPSLVDDPADADRCVTPASTRKALEALFGAGAGPIDHAAVGVLTARVDPPRTSAGGLTAFVERDGCWSGVRVRTFGPGAPVEVAMAVVVLGVGTAGEDAAVRALVDGLERQVSAPLALDLVMIREPAARLEAPATALPLGGRLALPELPARSTPCASLSGRSELRAADVEVDGAIAPTSGCDDPGLLSWSEADVRRAWRRVAGLDPRVGEVVLSGSVELAGDAASVRGAVEALADGHPVADRPLVFWGALTDALRLGDASAREALWRPRRATVVLQGVRITRLDDRPWLFAGAVGAAVALALAAALERFVSRVVADRAFRRHLGAAAGRPVAAVLAEAQEAARAGWWGRVAGALAVGAVAGVGAALLVLLYGGGALG